MGCKVFGRREGVPFVVKEATGIEDAVFVQKSATAGERYADLATAGQTYIGGLLGVIQTGNWHGYTGTSTDKYPAGADVNVVSNGQVRVKILQTDSQQADYLASGDLVKVGTGGKAEKWAAPTITPSMTATLGDIDWGAILDNASSPIGSVDLGAIITGATATLSASPTATEIKAWLEEVIETYEVAYATELKTFLEEVGEDYDAALAVKIKAYEEEFVGDYKTAFLAGYDNIVGRCVGAPSSGLVCVELFGLGGIQNG